MKHTICKAIAGVFAFILAGGTERAFGFAEYFNTDAGNTPAAMNAAYPGYLTRAKLTSGSDDLSSGTLVSLGELVFTNDNNGTISFITQGLTASTSTPFRVGVDLRATGVGTPGNYSLGVVVGNRAFGFFPGYASAADQHLARSYDPSSGLTTSSYLNFLSGSSGAAITGGPDHLEVSWDGAGNWTYTFTKTGGGTGNSFSKTFADSFTMGEVGVFSRSDTGLGNAIFDNLFFEIPEPSAAMLLAAGAVLLWRRTRNG